MKMGYKTTERDRAATEQRLLDTLGEMIRNEGFEKIGVNAVANQSNVSKILIYRYFGSVEGLMATYIHRHDFWINFPLEIPEPDKLPQFLKTMFRRQIEQLRSDPVIRRLNRWELSTNNQMIATLREQREQTGLALVRGVSAATGRPEAEVAAIATLIASSVTYLTMLGEFCPVYNAIPLGTAEGWERITREIDHLINNWFRPAKP